MDSLNNPTVSYPFRVPCRNRMTWRPLLPSVHGKWRVATEVPLLPVTQRKQEGERQVDSVAKPALNTESALDIGLTDSDDSD